MTWLVGDRERDGWLITGGREPPRTPLDEYRQATGIRLAHDFRGDSLTDAIGGVVLTPTSATIDNLVSNTLDGDPISDPPSLLWSHAYKTTGTGSSLAAGAATDVDFGLGSWMAHFTVAFDSQAAACDLGGNRDGSSEGWLLRWTQASDLLQVLAQPVGEALVVAQITEVLDSVAAVDHHEVVIIADRANDRLRLATINAEVDVALPATGSFTTAAPFAIGKVLGLSCIATVMGVRVAFGSQVENRSPLAVAQASAKLIWWDDEFTRVETDAK
jgi:hypothetical protein